MLCTAPLLSFFFFFTVTATPEIYTLSLHDALPISDQVVLRLARDVARVARVRLESERVVHEEVEVRSEEHTSELQSQSNLVCRLLLEKKKTGRSGIDHGRQGAPVRADAHPGCTGYL